ncbi:MAG: hypothetical protein AAFP28_09585 [Pseudomonadota bacterium]
MKRILIISGPEAGKSTPARDLGTKTVSPLMHVLNLSGEGLT